ncbi:hypothetical protein RHGRI_006827 [Rhododendron griersonianum]|uniref:CCHC-type domain-containing protein n=3 Tax=Rhododendron griersonianum TaxID=479676 RepID=A0AAV6KVB1_9ERIC|nr:hypothetical protein RHGRI_006827 [Rhododendron griersonianum]
MNHPSSRTPILDSENFEYWKSRIKAIMRSVDEEIWNSCIGGYSHPTKKVEEKQVPKLTAELSQAWDILVTCHEGTDVVKQSKLQRLTTEFEIIRMQEDENFNEFYSKLIAIVNSCETLGEPIPPFRVIKKILRSLPERFKTKVTMLEGKRKLNEKSVKEVVGILQTYEADMLQPESLNSKVKPSAKSIAFASSQSESRESDCDGKNESSSAKEKKGIKSTPAGPKCYECQGYGHVAHECINKLKKKTNFKANITWDDDSESDNSEEEQVDHTNFMAFGASLKSNLSDHESSDDSENEGSDEEFNFDELKQSYNMLFKESVKINESNLKMAENYNNSKKELETAKKQVDELQVFFSNVTSEKEKLSKEVERLQEKNRVLIELNTASDDKINMLNAEIGNANILFERLNTGSKTLDDILSIQRPASDKTGLGFYEASSSKIVGGKPNELESKKVMPKPCSIDTAKNVIGKTHDINKGNFTKFIPTCHYCQVKGHIRPNCFKLHGYPNAKHACATNKRWSYDNFAPRWNNGLMPRPVGYNDGHTKDMKPRHMSISQGKSSQVETLLIWVRRCDLHCLATHTVTKAKKINVWNLNGNYSHHMSVDNSVGVRFID